MAEKGVISLNQFCDELDHCIVTEPETASLLEKGEKALQRLLGNREFVCQVLEKLITSDDLLKGSIGTIDRHDLGIFLSPKGNFSIKLFVWLPGIRYPIHDHGAWGIVGGFANQTRMVKYERVDDGAREGYARIEETGRQIINPLDVLHVLPYSIHHMSSFGNSTALTVHVYGRALRKGYIQSFNETENSVCNILTPKLEKRWHAIHALGAIGGDFSRNLLEKAAHDAHPLMRWTSIEVMKEVDRDGYRELLRAALNDPNEEVRRKAKAASGEV